METNSFAHEKFIKPLNGYVMLILGIVLVLIGVGGILGRFVILGIPVFIIGIFVLIGLRIVEPNKAAVLTLFGKYTGTVVENGFIWINPFSVVRSLSLRACNLNSDQIKVNDKMGNPILISAVIVWRVKDTFKASFDVDDYREFVEVQSEAAVRKLAASYCYDSIEGDHEQITLRGGGEEVNDVLEHALKERLKIAGVEVIEGRISNLAYAPEIAGAMLQRQQATAIVAARQKIVEGAVSMVEMALDQLSERKIVDLDKAQKASMVSNLLVVLTSDRGASPVLNTDNNR